MRDVTRNGPSSATQMSHMYRLTRVAPVVDHGGHPPGALEPQHRRVVGGDIRVGHAIAQDGPAIRSGWVGPQLRSTGNGRGGHLPRPRTRPRGFVLAWLTHVPIVPGTFGACRSTFATSATVRPSTRSWPRASGTGPCHTGAVAPAG